MASSAELDALIASIYDAALDASAWTKVRSEIARCLGARHVSLWVGAPGEDRTPEDWDGIDADFVRSYEGYFGRLDPVVRTATAWRPGTICTDDMILPRSTFVQGEFYQDWVRPQGMHSIVAANFFHEGDVVGLLGAPRDCREAYAQRHLDLLAALLPHLQRAVRIQCRLNRLSLREQVESEALNVFVHAVLIVGKDTGVIFANRAAEKLLACADGIRAGQRGLLTDTASSTLTLQMLVVKATSEKGKAPAGGAMLLPRKPPRGPLQMVISPLGPHFSRPGVDTHERAAMLLIIDPSQEPQAVQAQLAALFGLTPAEARTACEIGKGHNPNDVADALGVLPSTVRTHLHHVFAKTETRRQAELMRLVARFAVVREE